MQLLSVLLFFYTKLDLYKLTVLRSFGGGYTHSYQNGFFQHKKSSPASHESDIFAQLQCENTINFSVVDKSGAD